ncbi:Sec39 domain-containing protein [Cephalotus follicularis]|uniref:Sec39 domain-containing protein n=1 Tax=Cephalotus follicularis TaxID=3775 RepID=A0A1Q3CRF4_CEPFO|nr:Sec39 domain-containing protein [Cephalotus follicularis]
MEDTTNVKQVLYETRHHASRPYTSNYPPLQQLNEGASGGLLSLLSVRGVSLLKGKWSGYRQPKKIKKTISLFVSPRGERVAVAAGNKITILRKEDDYQEPCGIFSCDSLCAFTCGAWSEPHDVLGVVDDTDTIYFIKTNGEEITRITKKHFKGSASVIGLIMQDDIDAQRSYFFTVLTSDGLLHHVEISQEPRASISTIVGCAVSLNTSGNSGSCYLSFWHRCPSLDLEHLFSTHFEGQYSKTKGYVGWLAYPKVLISPLGKYVATLDVSGCLHVFKLDKESCLLIKPAFRESFDSQAKNNIPNGGTEFLCDIVDFTWWSDHILTLAKRSGSVSFLDILSDSKLQENDHVYSLPVLERVQKLQGCLFLLESTPCEGTSSSSNYARKKSELPHIEQITEDRFNQYDISKLRWSLISFSERSIPEMFNILISNHKYQAALDFANCHGLDRDEVLKAQWLRSGQGVNDINMFLSNIKDQAFVLSECIDKVGPTEEAMKALLAHGLNLTNQYGLSESSDYQCSQIWDFRLARLQLLQFQDRLESYLGINMGSRFSVQEYSKFRCMPINEAAVTLAESGKIGALNLLFKRHPYSMSPFILQILAAIPETVPVQTYVQLLPGRSPSATIALREEDWVECDEMLSFISKFPENHEISIHIRTEHIVKKCLGSVWPSINELSLWYKNRARDIDSYSGQLDNCLCLVDSACRKGIHELQQFHEDILYLHQLVYNDEIEGISMSLVAWEELSDYEKFRTMIKGIKEENVVEKLHDKAIPFMRNRSDYMSTLEQVTDDHSSVHHKKAESFLGRWLKEIAMENKLDICMMVIEEGCKEFQTNDFFTDEMEAIDCALQCIYLCTATDRWSTMASILSKLPQKQETEICVEGLEERLEVAEGHIEAGRLLSFYQVPKPINFFLEPHLDEKGVKQILRLILSKFIRRQPSRSDNDWANMWRDMQCLREKAFPFLDLEYMLIEFCRGLLKAGKFSLARNYLRGASSVTLASEKAENLVIQAAREYFFSASSLACSEIWKAKECLKLFPNSRSIKTEADIIDALTVKLPKLGVSLLPMQFRQIKDPMEIIKMAITSQAGAYLHVDELIEVAKLFGLSSLDDISAVEEAIAREAAVSGDMQLAFDLCLVLVKKGHGLIWDLCAAIARGPALENMDISSRKQLIGFALSHCDDESICELLHAWKDLDMQGQCETLLMLTGTNPPHSDQGFSVISLPDSSIQDIVDFKDCSELVEGVSSDDQGLRLNKIKTTLAIVAKNLLVEDGTNWESLLRENVKILSFAALHLPWLLDLIRRSEHGKRPKSGLIPGNQYVSVRTHAAVTILSWLARNGFAPRDSLIASLAKSIIEPPVTEEEDVIGCSFLLNLVDAFNGVEVIEEQLRTRDNYQEICSIMNVGMTYSILHNSGIECEGPAQRRELLLRKFKENHTPLSSDEIIKIDKEQSTFWREWKLKLEEKKRVADRSRVLEQIIPGVETARFLSGDISYIESVIFSLIESVKLERKHILKDVLRLAETYGLNRTEVVLRYLSSILVSAVWAEDDVMAEISEIRGEIIGCAPETIKTLSLIVYPAVDGCNKEKLACIYGLLADCYLQLEQTKESLLVVHPDPAYRSILGLARFYKVIEQECRRVSFVKSLNFKNIAGLGGLNLQCFSSEVYTNIDELSLEALAKMVQTLVSNYTDPIPEGLIFWQDVYKHYVLNLLTSLESKTRTHFKIESPDIFQGLINQLEQTYDFCRMYIRLLEPSDALDITKHCFTIFVPLYGSYYNIPDNSTWQDCLIFLLNFWIRLTEDLEEIFSSQSSVVNLRFNPECLIVCLKVFMRLVMEDNVSPSQGWGTILGYINCGLIGDFSLEIFNFCRSMIFSGCGYGAIFEVYSEAISQSPTSDTEFHDFPHLYLSIFEPILQDLVGGSLEHQNLYHFLSSLSKMEGDLEELKRARRVVWERMVQFSDNSQLPSQIRVYVLELMQFITGITVKGYSSELHSNVLPWEGWDESLYMSKNSETTVTDDFPDQADNSSRFTATLVALKSSQLVASISPGIEITPDDLLNEEAAVACFLKLCRTASTRPHFDALLATLEEWEGLFSIKRDEEASAEESDAGNWGNDDWDEGWESFQEVEPLGKEKENSLSIHPLHACWMEIFKKFITVSRFREVLRLIDQSLMKSNGILLDEDGARSLTEPLLEVDCFLAVKMVLLLPYEAIKLQYLSVVENKLKQTGISDSVGGDHEFLMLVLSSGVISTIVTKSSYDSVFSYLCYLVGNLSRQFQETQLLRLTKRGNGRGNNEEHLFIFRRILFPAFISELVKADQHILAGFLVTKFMHANASLSLINVAEASLSRYLEKQLSILERDGFALEDTSCGETLKHTVSSLGGKLGNLIQSALPLLSTYGG